MIQIDKTFRYDVNLLLVGTKHFFMLSQGDVLLVHWNKEYNAPWIKIRFLQCMSNESANGQTDTYTLDRVYTLIC